MIKDFTSQMELSLITVLSSKIEKYFWEEKEHFFHLEKEALKNHPRLSLYHQILMSVPKFFNISQKDDFTQQTKTLFKRNTKDIILEGGWIMK